MRRVIPFLLLAVLVLTVFHSWFLPGYLSTFDFPYFSNLAMSQMMPTPYAWGWLVNLDGLSRFMPPYYWVYPLLYWPQVLVNFGIDWAIIARIFYLFPTLIFMIISPIILTRTLFPKNKFYLLSVLIFLFNTYTLLLVGGEIFLAFAFSLSPIVFALVYKILNRKKLIYSIMLGIILSLQIMVDSRISFVTILIISMYFLYNYIFIQKPSFKDVLKSFSYIFIIPGTIVFIVHAFWILPTLFYGKNPVQELGSAYSTSAAVKFFSFAKLENTISLLHPNWPENIFGKVDFMRPEFLILPILAFGSLLFNRRGNPDSKKILFFAALGLFGVFISKGTNDPLPGIYLWMFYHVPGFILFRDPAKFYLITILSYSILIPFTVNEVYQYLSKKQFSIFNFKFLFKSKWLNIQNLFLLLVTFYFLLLIRPAILGQLGGLYKTTSVPADYVTFEKFLDSQKDFSRTLWVPSVQHFGYYSSNHPEVSARILFNEYDPQKLVKILSTNGGENFLEDLSVKYVIVPYDSEKELFIDDRKFNLPLYQKTVDGLSKIAYFNNQFRFGDVVVYEVPNSKNLFWSDDKSLSLDYKYINSTQYYVSLKNARAGDRIIFTDQFDSGWEGSTPYKIGKITLNSFILAQDGDYELKIYYKPQQWVDLGIKISVVSILAIFVGTLFILIKRKI